MKFHTWLSLSGIISILFLGGCQSGNNLPVADDPQMLRIAAPVLINPDSTVIELSDYLIRPARVDSIMTDPAFTAVITPDSTKMIIKPLRRDFPKLSAMTIWSEGFPYTLMMEKTSRIWYRFSFDPGNHKYKSVMIKGQMNEWNPSAGVMKEHEGKWIIDFYLFPGKYQYKLIADGREFSDPNNRDSVSNGMGGHNSLLTVGNLTSSKLPVLYTRRSGGRNIVVGIENKSDTIFVLWQNHLLDGRFWKMDTNGILINVPGNSKKFTRSFIRVYAANQTGLSNEILVPLHRGKVLTDPDKLNRSDFHAMIMYFMMVDRFRNGNPSNDAPVNDPEIDPKVNFMGGDLAGINQALENGYFRELGVNALWISPITQNPLKGYVEFPPPHRKFSGYHGYWPVTLTTVDTRFGTSNELKQLVEDAHDAGMNMILDFVAHHAHEDYPLFKTHPDWVTPLELPGNRKNIRIWDEERLTTWFDTFLPTFDLTKPEVTELVSDSALFWIKNYDFDGFRHDAAKHVPEIFWRTLTRKIDQEVVIPDKRPVYQIGETFGSRDLVGSYVNPGMLDAQFEFNLYWDIRSSFAYDHTSLRDLNYSLLQSFSYYGEHNLMGNITGNQDMPRVISFAGGSLDPSEDAVEAGWKRDIRVRDTTGYQRLAMLHAFNMTIPGIPVIYYGDEFGMPGAGDPDNRRMMKFDSLDARETKLKNTVAKLARMRNAYLALTFGDFRTLRVTDRSYVYLRSYFDQVAVVIFNKDKQARKVEFELPERFHATTLKAHFGNTFLNNGGTITVELPAHSFEILTQ